MSVLTRLITCFILLTLFYPASAMLTTTFSHDGGSACLKSERSYETGSNLLRFGAVNGTYEYGAASVAVLSQGRTAIEHQMESANGIIGSTKAESLGILNAFDTIGLLTTQSYNPSTPCDAENFIPGGMNDSPARYPQSQNVEGISGMMGLDGLSSYESATVVAGKSVALSTRATSADGYIMGNLIGSAKLGFDTNASTQNADIKAHDYQFGQLTEQNRSSTINFLWNEFTVNASED